MGEKIRLLRCDVSYADQCEWVDIEDTYINKNRIRGNESSIVLEEEGGGDLRDGADDFIVAFLLLSFDVASVLVLLESCIALTDNAFDSAELAGLLCNTHDGVAGVDI